MRIKEGEQAPDFSLPASDDSTFNLYELLYQKIAILSFYPKNHLFGCPSKKVYEQSKSLVDSHQQIVDHDAEIFGISVDTVPSHKKFISEYRIPYKLLSDEKKEVIKVYAEQNIYGLAKRSFVIIKKNGEIYKILNDINPYNAGNSLLGILKNLA